MDLEHGGIIASLDRDGTVVDTDKGVWQQGRFTWLLGELYNNVEPRAEWLELAKHGVDFIDRHCFDPADGRMWFHVTREGRPIRKRRYAPSARALPRSPTANWPRRPATQSYAEKARRAFQSFIDHNFDPQDAAAKIHRHATDARHRVPDDHDRHRPGVARFDWLGRGRRVDRPQHRRRSREFHLKPDIRVRDGDGRARRRNHRPLRRSDAQSGPRDRRGLVHHVGREASRTMTTRRNGLPDARLDVGAGLGQRVRRHPLFHRCHGRPVQEYWHDMKFWWPHNEAIIATLLAFHLTGDPKYADWHTPSA